MLTLLMVAFLAWLALGKVELRRMTPQNFAEVLAGRIASHSEVAAVRGDSTRAPLHLSAGSRPAR